MNKNKILKFIYWSLGSLYIFAGAAVAISVLKPGPTESQVMRWMAGMMNAMHSSLMGASLEGSEQFSQMLGVSAELTKITILLGLIAGLVLRMVVRNDKR